jgi:hypothetical protein
MILAFADPIFNPLFLFHRRPHSAPHSLLHNTLAPVINIGDRFKMQLKGYGRKGGNGAPEMHELRQGSCLN